MDRLKAMGEATARQIDKLAAFGPLAVISILLLAVVAIWLNPAKAGSYIWVISKLSLAAVMGEAFYRAMRRPQPDPEDALARSMAQTQRATLIAASIIAAGLMP